jgi:predicted metal-binding membrane protein
MAALFALGVMNTVWMAFVAALVAAEKLAPWRLMVSRGVALLLAVLALRSPSRPMTCPA